MRRTLFPLCILCSALVSSCGGRSATPTAAANDPAPAITQPAILTQPANQSVQAGQTAIFSVSATGTAPLSYQWQKNGANISGAISVSYKTPAATLSDNGSIFQVIVTNTAGAATSNGAALTVTSDPPPPSSATVVSISVTPTSATLLTTQTQQFTGIVTYSDGSTDQNIQWSAIGAGTVSSSGLFTPNALGTATVVGAATADPSISQAVIVNVVSLVGGKFAGLINIPATAENSQVQQWWSFNADQDSSGNVTTESGLSVTVNDANPTSIGSAVPNYSNPATQFPFSGTNTNSLQLIAAFGTSPGQTFATLTGMENSDGSLTGTLSATGSGTFLPVPATGTFSFVPYGLLNGNWSGSVGMGQNSSGTLSVSLALTEVPPTDSTPRQFTGAVTLNGNTYSFGQPAAFTQGDLFEIHVGAVPCQIVGAMADPTGTSLYVIVGSVNVSEPSCPVGSGQAAMTLAKQAQ